nr:zinc finger CCCH domain-containing protein 10-like [Onthophagus taurus]
MSDTSDDVKTEPSNDSSQDSICRDFSRGTCNRKFCKYKHETEVRSLNFCHDFQNATCPRPNCKFIHCTREEVEEYKKTGDMSNQILAEASRKSQLPGLLPVCNMFRKGACRRPVCKYRHITKEEEDNEIMELIRNNSNNQIRSTGNNVSGHEPQVIRFNPNDFSRNRIIVDDCNFGPTPPKRRFLSHQDVLDNGISTEIHHRRIGFRGYFAGNPPPGMLSRIDARTIMLEEENSMLHKEIAQLKRKVSDLTATNEFLLDQNATLRVTTKRNASVAGPAVTLANSLSQNTTPQVIRTVTASVATVPVSLATVTTCNPVSGNSVSISGCPAVSIAAPAQILAPSQQILVTTNQSNQLALANSSQAQLAIAQQNLANNLAQQAQPQLTSQAQQLALATTTQQLTSQAQHMANQQLALGNAPQQLTSQGQQIAIANGSQQIALTGSNQQLTLANTSQQLANQQLNTQAQQIALANTLASNTNQQLTSQAQQLALANTPQQLAVASVPQQLALASTNQQLLAAQQNLGATQQLEMHRGSQMTAINTSQPIAMSNATQPMVSYPIMTQSMNHALSH